MTAPALASVDSAVTPPNDIAAEQAVLGAMMCSADAIADVAAVPVTAAHFFRPAHQVVCEAILELYDRGDPVDPVTVADLLSKRQQLGQAGGALYLHDLLAAAPSHAQAGYHARLVREKADLRAVIEAGTRMVQLGYQASTDALEVVEQGRQMLDASLGEVRTLRPPSAAEIFCEVLDSLERQQERGLPTPWADINAAVPGLAPGELIVIGASSGTGKSMAGLNIVANLALRQKIPVVVFTMEMTRHEVMMRLISAEARVPLRVLLRREMNPGHWDRIAAVQDLITDSPLVIDDSPAMSVTTIRSRLREMARSEPAGLAFVDYLGLLREPARSESRQVAVASNARALKDMAGEFGIPILAAAQLNREMEHRKDKRPQPSDLRDSAEIEHAASVIILLHREDVHGEETPRAGMIDFLIRKNRNGSPADVTLMFQGDLARCVDYARNWSPSSSLGDGK